MLSDDEIKAGILFKLHRRGNWGASYGLQVSLNARQSDTIVAFMRRLFPEA